MSSSSGEIVSEELAALAHLTTIERLSHLVSVPGAQLRRGTGWTAVRSGIPSNDDNVVLSTRDARIAPAELDSLRAWMRGVPWSWYMDSVDDALTAMLLERGADPERTGWWCGRPLQGEVAAPTRGRVETVTADHWVEGYLDVFEACGWFEADERAARRAQLPWDSSFRHVVVLDGDEVVGGATGFVGTALEIVDVAVRTSVRRRGFGRALVGDLERWGAARGVDTVYAAPSQDGAELFRALGFAFARVQPDVCFYLSR